MAPRAYKDAAKELLSKQDLDEATLAYLAAALDEEDAEGFCDIAEAFVGEAVLSELREVLADAAADDSTCQAKDADAADAVDLSSAAAKTGRAERRQAKGQARPGRARAKGKVAAGRPAGESADDQARNLQDVAAFGLAETEEGLDAFDSFAICWGRSGEKQIQNSEMAKDIILPTVYIGIVTELGQKDLISGSSLRIMRGKKYGLIGRNGCGKTTLLRRIARRQLPGLPNIRYGYVAQELVGTEATVLDVACSGDAEYKGLLQARADLEKALEAGDSDGVDLSQVTQDFARVVQRLDEVEDFFGKEGLQGHARDVLLGLQFTPEMLEMPTRALSGGWRMRLALAQALLSRADCLLLDEPTNHLDLNGVLWLQHFLSTKLDPDCMLVMISHDRAVLDSVVTDIIEIRREAIHQGAGNLTSWQQRSAEEREWVSSKLEANERERARTKGMIQKMRETAASNKKGKEADGNKLRQAKQREEWLFGKISSSGEEKTFGRLEMVNMHGKMVDIKALAAENLVEEEKLKIKLPEPELLRGALLQLDGASFSYRGAARSVLANVSLSLEPQSCVAVVGGNGAGKTTLLRWLEGEHWPTNKAHRHPKLKVAHVSQHHLEHLEDHLAQTCVDWIRGVLPPLEPGQDPNTTLSNVAKDEFLFGFLANFGLGGIAKQKLGTLSGGQKARLAFAAQVWHRPHLLLLDEPTNHLDIETLDSLAASLRAFQGAVVIVSHNQGFLSEVCNELWIVDGGKVTRSGGKEDNFKQGFEAYTRKVLKRIGKSL